MKLLHFFFFVSSFALNLHSHTPKTKSNTHKTYGFSTKLSQTMDMIDKENCEIKRVDIIEKSWNFESEIYW